ncbi:MAG: RND transporter [Pseudorhodoplanes sp.]
MPRRLFSVLAAAALFAAFPGFARSHEGHDHGAQAPAAPATVLPRGEAHSDMFELVAVAERDTLILYLDDYRSNAPVDGAKLEIETPDGPKSASALGNGIYKLEASFLAKGGHVDLIVTVNVGDTNDILPVTIDIPELKAVANANSPSRWLETFKNSPIAAGLAGFFLGAALIGMLRRRRPAAAVIALLVVTAFAASEARAHDGHGAEAPAAASSGGDQRAERLPDGAVFVPKPIQRIFGLRTIAAEPGKFARSVELPGRIIPDPNTSGYVQTAVGGILSPPPGGFPRLGAPVTKGEVLAYVVPPIAAIDVSDMRQKQGELDQQIAIVQRRLVRYESLVSSGAVARTTVDETRLELEGLKDRRAALDRIRSEPVPLIAPVSGVIAEGTPITGQIAQTNAIVFHIVTPDKLWVEALSFDTISGSGRASARTGSGKSLALTFRGSGLADRSQSIPVHFSIDEAGKETGSKGLRAGQFVSVFAESGEERSGIAVPRTAIVRASNGQDFVFEHTSAERFEPRPVRTEPLDGERVLIATGIDAGKRLVIQGAELLDHVR